MSHLAKYIVAVLLGAGVLLGGASLVDAHSPPWSWYEWQHEQTTSDSNMCAYECALKNHEVIDFDPCESWCKCKD